ncbi:MAG: hypothetical protein EOM20_10500 [Spartobacteria bacterium]|nr:hypothetical protein [Spartobacteria bacterium]
MRPHAVTIRLQDAIHDLQTTHSRQYEAFINALKEDYENLKERLVDRDDAILRGRAQQLRDMLTEHANNRSALGKREEFKQPFI